jgi:DNA polymerase elongation subunit (family B)
MKFYTNVVLVGNEILSRGFNNGEHFKNREMFYPTLYVTSNKKTKFKTLEGSYVEQIKPGTIRETREFIDKYQKVDNFKLYGNTRYVNQYISDNYPEEAIKFDISKIKLVTIDIEVASENGFPDVQSAQEELLTISLQDYTTKNIITWGVKPFNNTQENVNYILCRDEYDLLDRFMFYWENNCPEVVTGWNCDLYDIPYLYRRISTVLGGKVVKQLSPWGIVTENEALINGRPQIRYDIAGVTILDYLELYRKFTYTNQESYRLDHIASVELGQNKLDHSEYDTFKEFYTKNWQKFVEYNIKDVELVDRLEDKMRLIELAITMAYDGKGNFNDVFYQVRMWDSIIYNYLRKKDIVIPFKTDTKKDEKYAGAYVKEPIPGKYDWVVSFDLNSLYPHLIMQYNISPETLLPNRHPKVNVDKILNKEINFDDYKDYAVCANGAMYRKDIRGFLPELMDKMYSDRVIYKKKMLEAKQEYEKTPSVELMKEIARCNNIQMAKKISLNSAYGAVGNEYFRYFMIENAEAVTLSGQVSIRWIESKVNKYLNKVLKSKDVDYVIASDTDSIYLNMGPLVETVFQGREKTTEGIVSFLDKICKVELEKYIESSYQELAEYVNAYEQKMQMKRENIAERGIWTAKKRYILNVWDSEGVRYSEPKLKIMGIEAVKSSTPAPCRQMIKDALKIIMTKTEDDLIDYIDKSRKKFYSLPPEEIAFPRTANNISKYKSHHSIYEKGCPIHVRGVLLYNYYIKKNNLDNKYPKINNGEKVKFCYLKKANPIRENVLSFIQQFPKELNLGKYVDYELQFEKSFIDPLKTILQCIGWRIEKTNTIESLFL